MRRTLLPRLRRRGDAHGRPIVRRRTILAPAPPERIWPLIDAVERHREWDPRVIRGESLDRGQAVFGVGRRDRIVQRIAGAVVEADMVVSEHQPPEAIAWTVTAWRAESHSADLSSWQSVRLQALEEGTLVSLEIGYTPAAPWQRLLSSLGRRWENRELDRALEGLAQRCGDGTS